MVYFRGLFFDEDEDCLTITVFLIVMLNYYDFHEVVVVSFYVCCRPSYSTTDTSRNFKRASMFPHHQGASLIGGVCTIPAEPHKNTKLSSSKPQSRGVCARPAPRLKQTTLTYNVKRKRVTVLRDDETDCDEVSLY